MTEEFEIPAEEHSRIFRDSIFIFLLLSATFIILVGICFLPNADSTTEPVGGPCEYTAAALGISIAKRLVAIIWDASQQFPIGLIQIAR